jgi:nicotinamidase-related amidase
MSKQALVIIDIQNDYFPGGKWTLSGMDAAADNAGSLLAEFRKRGDLVVHVRHESTEADAPFFVPGTEGAAINARVTPKAGEAVIVKNHVNSFRETKLKEILDKNGITAPVFCGAMSHMCVDAAVRAANDFGYDCTVIHDACASRDLEFGDKIVKAADAHAAYMSALGFAYAKLSSTKDYLAGGK